MRIVFIGGTRFIGHAAAERALERGHEVVVMHRGNHPCELGGVVDRRVDRNDPSELATALAAEAPDVMIDTRAMTKSDAETTALAAKVAGCAAVVLSSQDVYAQLGRVNGLAAPDPEELIDERSPLTVPYPFRDVASHEGGPDYDKKDVEAVFRDAAGELPRVTVLRLPAVYGARDPKRRFGWALDALDAGRTVLPVQGGGRWRWTHSHVRDVAHAVVLAAESSREGFYLFNVGEAQTPTMRERVADIARVAGHDVCFEESDAIDEAFALLGQLPNDIVVSSERLRRELAFEEITTDVERLRDLVRWLRDSRVSVS